MNVNDFRETCGMFDSVKCATMLNSIRDSEVASKAFVLEEHVRQSGCLIQPKITTNDSVTRNHFISYCREEIAKSGDAELVARFEQHLKEAVLFERGYQAILETLKNSPSGQLPPGTQLWAAIDRAVNEIAVLHDQVQKAISSRKSLFDPVGAMVERDDAPDIAPDTVIYTVIKVLGSTIMMLAWENGWYENRRLKLPNVVDVTETILLQAGVTAFLGNVWRSLKHSDDQIRYFGGDIRLAPIDIVDRNNITHKIDALLLQHEMGVELIDLIADERFVRRLFQFSMNLSSMPNAEDSISKAKDNVPLAPLAYISFDERLSFYTLSDLFCYPVESDKPVYKGLALKHWLRGYALLKEKLAYSEGVPIIELRRFTTDELVSLFTKFGFTSDQAYDFLEATTFSSGKNDLFDTPFLRGQDDSWYFFAPAYIAANLSSILVSMLSTNGVQIQSKGKKFESNILTLLQNHGLNAKGFKYSIGGKQFECDAAFVWEDRLFVFECKNYGLSGLNVKSAYHFFQSMQEAAEQVERISAQLNADPSIVQRNLGPDIKWSVTVPCVINAMPWSAGKLGDTYFYDSSALTKFFEDGFLAIVMPIKVNSQTTIHRRHKFSLWSGEKPTAQDLLLQLEKPLQIQILEDEWEIDAPLVLLSKELGLVSPYLKRKAPDPKRTLKSYGLSDDDISKLLRNFEDVWQQALKVKAKHSLKL